MEEQHKQPFFFKDIYISNTDFIKKERRAKP